MTETPRRIGALDPDHEDYLDPDLAPPSSDETGTTLDQLLGTLEAALIADVTFEPITLEVEKRPGVAITYSTNIDDEKLTTWRKRAADKKSPDGVNGLRFCALVVANQCIGMKMNGQPVTGEQGEPLTFGHARIRKLYGAQRAADAVTKCFGADPHVMAHANAIMEAAGFGDQAVEVDGEETPTTGF